MIMKGSYISKQRGLELQQLLGERDKAILASLRQCRYLLTSHVRRLHFIESANPAAGTRATNRTMQKLRHYGLVDFLQQRIGGIRAGSLSYVWALTEQGDKFLSYESGEHYPRKRSYEPSLYFLKHTLAVAETYIQLGEICKQHQLALAKAELEPECWRKYEGEYGKPATLKPDLFAVVNCAKYVDNYFFEVDLNTESPKKVLGKCQKYAQYCLSGVEQKEKSLFPLVVWITPSATRMEAIQRYIADSCDLAENVKRIFLVIIPDNLEPLLLNGVEYINTQKGEQSA